MAEARFQARSLLSHSNPDLRVGSLLSTTLQMGKLRPGEVFFFFRVFPDDEWWSGTPCWVAAPEPTASSPRKAAWSRVRMCIPGRPDSRGQTGGQTELSPQEGGQGYA